MNFSRTLVSTGVIAFALTLPAALQAATFNFMGTVTDTEGPAMMAGDADLPPLGAAGAIQLNIDDSDPTLGLFTGMGFAPTPGIASVSLTVPGFIAGSMVNNVPDPFEFFQVSDSHFAFGAYGPTSINDPGSEFFLSTGRHSFRVDFGSTQVAAPTTVGELVTALNGPGATGFFSHELEGSPGFVFTRVEFPATEIPLPASAFLLLGAFGGLLAMKRRRLSA
ncbi:MAG: VPLPA-CTERM sorting domain-containing protein [Pseudomonadota bacterium]